jgi:hypothetical protein
MALSFLQLQNCMANSGLVWLRAQHGYALKPAFGIKRLKHVKMAGHPRMSVPRQMNRCDGFRPAKCSEQSSTICGWLQRD